MKLILNIDTTKIEGGLHIGERIITTDKEFMALPRESQVKILQAIKNDLDAIVHKNNLITARQAGLN
jgi:hypothetical protein